MSCPILDKTDPRLARLLAQSTPKGLLPQVLPNGEGQKGP
jgi:hypothetical protein